MPLPNFLIIGAGKSGTSSLWRYLRQHPDIYFSRKKEPHFFSFEAVPPYAAGPGDFTKYAITDMQSYLALFDGVTTESAIGEASTTSLYFPWAAERIHYYLPKAKMIAILRHPAQRAYSAYMHLVRDKRETAKSFGEGLQLEESRISRRFGHLWHYKQMGFYGKQLSNFYSRFENEQIKVYLHEDLTTDPLNVVQDIFRFLGVDHEFVPDLRARANVSGKPMSALVDRAMSGLFDSPNPVRSAARQLLSEETRFRLTERLRRLNLARTPIQDEILRELISIYSDDILELQRLIDRDLSHWIDSRK